MKKKLDLENLSPEEVRKEILKINILNNKRLKSIDNSLAFIVLVFVLAIIISIFSILF